MKDYTYRVKTLQSGRKVKWTIDSKGRVIRSVPVKNNGNKIARRRVRKIK